MKQPTGTQVVGRSTEPATKPTEAASTAAPPTNTPQPAPSATPAEPTVGQPVRFKIDKIGIDAAIEYVGLTEERAMDVPKAWENVAWYKLGYVPGERGNAVIAGHLDSFTGPAVFWELDKLEEGDIVSILDNKGQTINFKVTKKAVYYNDEAPLVDIFGPTNQKHLNLITCDGVFDKSEKRYDRKLVVFTEKIEA